MQTCLVAAKVDRCARSTADFAGLLDRAEKNGWILVVSTSTWTPRLLLVAWWLRSWLLLPALSPVVSVSGSRTAHAVRKAQGKRAGQAPILSDEIRQRIYRDHELASRSMP